ncbi:MAG: TonB-dependent receptor [Paludibacteraceae bacterium]|nr:TonB-dependent receptor [Paludibacteraceae bacterium]
MKQKLNLRLLMTFVLGIIMSVSVFAQNITVKGHVKDDLGDDVIGASILIKGTSTGCTTDLDGNFSLSAPRGATLVISYIGYIMQEVKAAPQLNITLKEDVQSLSETVVIGYGSVKKNDMTGSVATFKPDEKNRGMITSPQELIQGKVAGVNVNMGSGEPGAGAQIVIRGGASLNASTKPLIVIDGMALDNNDTKGLSNPLSLVNPADIESFTVLKDASACAIYGSRGSNGVILITTKKGNASTPVKVSYAGSVSFATRTKSMDVMNASEYRRFIEENYGKGSEAWNHLGWKERDAEGNPVESAGTYDTDWQKEIFRTGVNHDHNVTVQGGIKAKDPKVFTMPYRVSAGFTGQEGIIKSSDYKRFTAGLSLTPELLDKHLTFNVNGKFVTSWTNPGSAPIGDAVNMDPTQPVKSADEAYKNFGGYFEWLKDAGQNDADYPYTTNGPKNPVEQVASGHNSFEKKAWVFIGNVETKYKVHGFEDLSFNLNLSGEWTSGDETTGDLFYTSASGKKYYCQPRYTTSCGYYGYGKYNTEDKHSLQLQAFANYDHSWGETHALNVMGGYEWSKLKYTGHEDSYSYKNSVYSDFGTNPGAFLNSDGELDLRDAVYSPWGSESYIVSFFGRVNYTLLNRYLFTFTGRNDGSSRFAKGNKWGFFPSAAFAWRIKDEAFMKNAESVSDMKLRLGWGKTGQQDIGRDFYYLATYTGNKNGNYLYPIAGLDGHMAKPNAYNDEIRWETTTTYNAGIDLGFLNQRFTFSADVYYRKTTDLFNKNTVPTGSNFDRTVFSNVGSMSNRGVELSLTARPVVTKDWYWEVSFNAAYNKNRVDELYGGNDKVDGWVNHEGTVSWQKVGRPTNSFYVYQQVYDKAGKPIQGVFVDRDGNGVIDENDKYWYKSINHPWAGGLSTRVQYKNWDFGMNLRGSFGGYVYNELESGRVNVAAVCRDYNGWYNQNTTQDIRDLGWNSYLYGHSDYFVQNASYIRCDNITLGYSFNNLFKSANYKGIGGRLSASVSNAFTITKYKGLDPEQTGGVEGSLYPRPRTYTLNLNLNF